MRRRGTTRFWVVLWMALASVGAMAAEGEKRSEGRVFKVEYLDVNEAGLYARQLCLERTRAECDFSVRGRGFLEIWSDEDTLEEVGRMLAQRDVPPRTQVFQVTLLIASGSGETDPRVPEPARKALEDVRRLLPFRGYRVLDTGIMRTSERALLALGGDQGYEAQLKFRGDLGGEGPLYVERFDLVQRLARWIAPPPPPETGGDPSKSRETVTRDIVGASFSMEPGETVVVGTSRLDGGEEALVVLLTALKG